MHCHVEVLIAFIDLTLSVRYWRYRRYWRYQLYWRYWRYRPYRRGNTENENTELFLTLTNVPFVTHIMLLYHATI